MNGKIDISLGHGILTLQMNRPLKKNALTADMYTELVRALKKAAQSDNIKCTLILGLPGIFCAGNDIGDFIQAPNAALAGSDAMLPVIDFLEQIIMAPKPVVAGVDGAAVGIGTTMLMHCDYVVASLHSTFSTPFVDLGVVPEAGSSLIAPRIMGYHRAFALLAMGETFTAETALAAGLVNRITRPENLEKRAHEAAHKIATKPQEALKLSRALIRGDRADILQRMKEEAVLFGQRLKTDEAQKAFKEFVSRSEKKVS